MGGKLKKLKYNNKKNFFIALLKIFIAAVHIFGGIASL